MQALKQDDLDLGNLPDMVGIELRIGQILAERAFSDISHTQVSPGLFMILALIRNNPGRKQTTLARSVKLDRSTMVPIMDHCERKGWVQRQPFAGDRRAHAIFLTASGLDLVDKLEQDVLKLEAKLTTAMGQQDRDQFLQLLKKFQTALALMPSQEEPA
jgi:DNA-binding MarR family transcriptional regulator